MTRSPRHRRPLIEALEPRLLFSATADIAVFDDGNAEGQYLAQAAEKVDLVSIYMSAEPLIRDSFLATTFVTTADADVAPQADLPVDTHAGITTIVFVDTAVDDYATLVKDISAGLNGNSVAIIYLDSTQDGVAQISRYLAGANGISAIHIISHGVAGNVQLGAQVLNENTINQFNEQLRGWQTALTDDADILLYGCELAANQSGINLLQQLSEMTGADIAASNNLTGNSSANSDWVLEEKIGTVEAASLFSANQPMEWQGTLADVVHLNSGAPTNEQAIPINADIKQGLQLNATQTIDRVQISLANYGTASSHVVMNIHQSSFGGPIVATASVATNTISNSLGVVSFDFTSVNLTAYVIYWVSFSTNDRVDNLISLGYINADVINSEYVVDNVSTPMRDMSIAVIEVQNQAPTVATPIPDQAATQNAAFSYTFPAMAFADADGDTLVYSAELSNGNPLPSWLNFDATTRTCSGTPGSGDVGTLSIKMIARDDHGAMASDTFDIVIASTNDAPSVIIPPTDYYADEQVPINLHGTGISVADVDDDPLTITLTGQFTNSNLAATAGTTGVVIVSGVNTKELILSGTAAQLNDLFAGNNGGTLTYRLSGNTPVATDTLTISASDGSLSGNDSAIIHITALNDAPINTVPSAQTTNEDTALVFSAGNTNQIQVGDFDVGSADLEVTLSVTHGTLTLAGITGLSFTTGDGTADSSLVFRGTQANINTALATLIFNPTANYAGAAVLTITTNDLGNTGSGGALSDTDTVNITVSAVNDVPTGADKTITTNEDTGYIFAASDFGFSDVDTGDMLSGVRIDSVPVAGSLTLSGVAVVAGDVITSANIANLVFTPAANANGTSYASFTFSVRDQSNAFDAAPNTITIDVTAVNDAPVAVADTVITLSEGGIATSLVGGGTSLLANDTDVEGSSLTAILVTNVSNGSLTLNSDGTFSYTHNGSETTTDSFSYKVNDGTVDGNTVTVSINITPVNNEPTGADNTITTNEDTGYNFTPSDFGFSDVDSGDSLSGVRIDSLPTAGSLTLSGVAVVAGDVITSANIANLVFTPAANANGTSYTSFTFSVCDQSNGFDTTPNTITINVIAQNDVPVVVNPPANQTAQEDSPFLVTFGNTVFADDDVGTTLVYTAQLASGEPLPSWLSFAAATVSFTGTPSNNDAGVLVIDIIASDGIASTSTQFQLTVKAINDAPQTSGFAPINNVEDAEGDTVNLFAAFSDEESDAAQLQYSVVSNSNPALVTGAVIDPIPGKLQLSYGANQFGSSDLIIRAQDADGASVETVLRVNIQAVNDVPTSKGIADVVVVAGVAPQQTSLHSVFTDIEDGSLLEYSVIDNSNFAAVTNISINSNTGVMTVSFATSTGGEAVITLRATDTQGAWVDTQFVVTVIPVEIVVPLMPDNPGGSVPIPPAAIPDTVVTPDTTTPITPPVNSGTNSPASPLIENPVVTPPEDVGGGSEIGTLLPTINQIDDADTYLLGGGLTDVGNINSLDNNERAEFASANDKSMRDYARADEFLSGSKEPLTTLTAPSSLASLISLDSGVAPWEAEEFDNEVRRIRAQMDAAMDEEHERKAVVAGLTFSITTGLLIWSLRASSLLLTMMSMLPLWRGIDPLPILDEVDKKKKELEQQRKDRAHEDKSKREVGYMFDHAQNKK